MDNNFKYSNRVSWGKYTKQDGSNTDKFLSQHMKADVSKSDEDLIIEENTIYEIDRDCVERLKKNRRR
ncbi:MAG: hypothetical protein GX321_04675 [Clostridiales bacterium]|nr:hypothetical protein [Clostridiales bacterium]